LKKGWRREKRAQILLRYYKKGGEREVGKRTIRIHGKRSYSNKHPTRLSKGRKVNERQKKGGATGLTIQRRHPKKAQGTRNDKREMGVGKSKISLRFTKIRESF